MNNDLSYSFRDVLTQSEADEIVRFLGENDISARSKRDEGDLNHVIQGAETTNRIEIFILASDKERARELLELSAKEQLKNVDPSYYLFDFTDAELIDVLIKNDEWNEFDVLLSEKILRDRNVTIDAKNIEKQRALVQSEYKKQQGGQSGWIILGYIMAVLGGFLGLIIGYFIWQAKNKLPSGEKVFAYTKEVRFHGMIIFFISAVVFPLVVIYRVILQL